jgi:hypothetical protein
MAIILNHTIVPARDKLAAARWFASIFGLNFNEQESHHFAPVRVNETLTCRSVRHRRAERVDRGYFTQSS